MKTIDFGRCDCGGKLLPIWDKWEDKRNGEKVLVRGISILRCEDCLKDYPAPSDFDVVVKL